MKNICTFLLFVLLISTEGYSQLLITEFSYNPPESNTDSLEYIELYNAGTTTLNLTKYKFSAGVEFTFPSMTLGAGKYMLLTVNDTAFFRVYGINALQWKAGALSNSGELVAIVDSLNNPVISVTYAKVAPWPTFADGTDGGGKSIELCQLSADPTQGSNWKVSNNDLGFQVNGKQIFGTPGKVNSITECSVVPDVTVEVSSNVFTPKDITIDVGQTVRWVNKGGTHNVNGTQTKFPNNPESFGNGAASSAAWTYDFKFTKPGLNNYQCDPHASLGMVGTVTVKSPVVIEEFPVRPIAKMSTTKADGVIDSLDKNCTLKGIVYGVNLRPAGLQFTLIDANNNGIGAFSNSSNFDYVVKEGDEVEVKGKVAQFNGFAQLTLTGAKKLTASNGLVSPKIITKFEENDESSLVTIKKLSFVDPVKWVTAGSGFNMDMTDGSTVFTVRIDNDIDAFNLPIPSGSLFNVTGLLGQFDNSAPYTEGYQLLPRYITDFVATSGSVETELDANVEIYPNPTTNVITIKTIAKPDFISLYDSKGIMVTTVKNATQIDMSALSNGIYMVRLVKGEKSSTVRVVKL